MPYTFNPFTGELDAIGSATGGSGDPAGFGTELQYRASVNSFGAVNGSSVDINGNITLQSGGTFNINSGIILGIDGLDFVTGGVISDDGVGGITTGFVTMSQFASDAGGIFTDGIGGLTIENLNIISGLASISTTGDIQTYGQLFLLTGGGFPNIVFSDDITEWFMANWGCGLTGDATHPVWIGDNAGGTAVSGAFASGASLLVGINAPSVGGTNWGNGFLYVNAGAAIGYTTPQTIPNNGLLVNGLIQNASLTASTPATINSSKQFTSGSYSGNTTKVVTNTGTNTNGNLIKWDASGNAIDAGIASSIVNLAKTNITLTSKTADITTTSISGAGTAGLYRVSYSLQDTTSDITAGAVTLTIAYTDSAGATTATAIQALTGTGRASGSLYIQLASGNITYATSHTGIFGTAVYALYITMERLS